MFILNVGLHITLLFPFQGKKFFKLSLVDEKKSLLLRPHLTKVSFTKWIILGKPFKSFLPADVTVLLASGSASKLSSQSSVNAFLHVQAWP